jgi:glycogen(starch) synthase
VRLLFVTPFYPPDVGGIEKLCAHLASRLRARGDEVRVLTATTDAEARIDDVEGVTVLRANTFKVLSDRDPAGVLRTQRAVNEFVREFDPELVHAHDTPVPLWLYLRGPARSTPLLVTLHNVTSLHQEGMGDAGMRLLRQADWCTAVSQDVVDDIVALEPWVTDRMTLVPNGMAPPGRAPIPIADDAPPQFVCVGRLVPQKGFDRAIRAAARLQDRLPGFGLTFVGDGPERSSLTTLAAELGVERSIEFLGWLEPDRVQDVMHAGVAVVMPSHFEGLPLVAAEAGFAARPVVGTRAPGLSRAVTDGENGLLVDPDDTDALASAMERVARDHVLARALGGAGLARARRDWSLDLCVDRYLAVYDAMPARHRARVVG